MNLFLYRFAFRDTYIVGRLFNGPEYLCDTLEPSIHMQHPCIPVGHYGINLNTISPKFGKKSPYNTLCKGCVPLICGVPGRNGILIHIGNECSSIKQDTHGCILVGFNTQAGKVLSSASAFCSLYKRMIQPNNLHNFISIYNVPCDVQSIQEVKQFY